MHGGGGHLQGLRDLGQRFPPRPARLGGGEFVPVKFAGAPTDPPGSARGGQAGAGWLPR